MGHSCPRLVVRKSKQHECILLNWVCKCKAHLLMAKAEVLEYEKTNIKSTQTNGINVKAKALATTDTIRFSGRNKHKQWIYPLRTDTVGYR